MSNKTSGILLSKKTSGILVGYGIVMAGFGFLVQHVAPLFGKVAFVAGVAGGGLCLLCGIAELVGLKARFVAILTTIAVFFVFLTQSVEAWLGSAGEGPVTFLPRLLLTASALLTAGMFLRVLHSERPPKFHETGPNHLDNTASSRNEAPSRETRSYQSKFAHWRHGRESSGAGGGIRGRSSFGLFSTV